MDYTSSTATSATISVSNTNKGSDQNIFKNIKRQNVSNQDVGNPVVADNNNDTLILKDTDDISITAVSCASRIESSVGVKVVVPTLPLLGITMSSIFV